VAKKIIETRYADVAREIVLGRMKQYGHPADHFENVASAWSSYLRIKWPRVSLTPSQVTDMMTIFKILREQNKHDPDNLIDKHGYALITDMLIEKEIKDKDRKTKEETSPSFTSLKKLEENYKVSKKKPRMKKSVRVNERQSSLRETNK